MECTGVPRSPQAGPVCCRTESSLLKQKNTSTVATGLFLRLFVEARPNERPVATGNLGAGRAGHVSHLHYDSHPGVRCGVRGQKKVDLSAPDAVSLQRQDARGA